MPDGLLLELVVVGLDTFVKPVRIGDSWHRVHTFLESCRDGHNLLNSTSQAFFVVIPVNKSPEVEVSHGGVFGPSANELLHYSFILTFKDSCRDSPVSNLCLDWLFTDQKFNIQTLVLDDLGSQ